MRLLAATLFAVAFSSAAAAAQPPAAADTPAMADARCLLEMVALSNATDPSAQRLGQGGIIYFTGRIAAREPNFDFARIKTLAETMDMKAAQTDLQQRCGPMFKASMQQLETTLAPPPGAAPPAGAPASPAPAPPAQ